MDEYYKLLSKLISFKSVSTDIAYKSEMSKTAQWLKNYLEENEFKVELSEPEHEVNPIIFAEHKVSDNVPTFLIYGHYDVQPGNDNGTWSSDPFELKIDKERVYGRGVVDNKGQVLIHIYSIVKLIKEKKLKFNIKFLIEGNEETGNGVMENYIKKNKSKLATDYMLISDGEIHGDKPLFEASLRGGMNVKLTIKTANKTVHSGIYGGAIPNAAQEMANLLSKLYKNNLVSIKGFYDKVDKITDQQREITEILTSENNNNVFADLDIDINKYTNTSNFYTLVGLLPTIEITTINSGYSGSGFANIVPNVAEVKLNFRTVMSQDSDEVVELFKEFLSESIPKYVSYELEVNGLHDPIKLNTNTEMYKKISEILEKVYGHKPLEKYVGGALPIVAEFKEIMGIEPMLIPLGNEDCSMHGPNENFRIDLIEKGIEFSTGLFQSSL